MSKPHSSRVHKELFMFNHQLKMNLEESCHICPSCVLNQTFPILNFTPSQSAKLLADIGQFLGISRE